MRIIAASTPPAMNIKNAVMTYRLAMALWSTVVIQPQMPPASRQVTSSARACSRTLSSLSISGRESGSVSGAAAALWLPGKRRAGSVT